MNFPKLKTRPRSTHTVYRFGGLWHSGEAPVGMTNGTTMRWEDMRGLGPDKYPMLSTAKTGSAAVRIDGNTINSPLIGAADGAHPVFLDEVGNLYCNGNTLPMFFGSGDSDAYNPLQRSFWTITPSAARAGTSIAIVDSDGVFNTLDFDYQHRTTITAEAVDATHIVYKGVVTSFADFGIMAHPVTAGDKFSFEFTPLFSGWYVPLVRMGAYVVGAERFCNVEDLAAGNTMTENENYGTCDAGQVTDLHDGNVTLTLCQMDGTPYTGAVAQTTPPSSHTNVWIDTSGNNAVAMEWSESYSTWIAIPSTYVKISGIHVAVQSNLDTGVLRTGDGVKFNITNGSGLDHDVELLLTSSHVLVEAKDTNNGVGYVIVPGTLPAATVTLTVSDVELIMIGRSMPTMDYMVECGNRLWGCRYFADPVTGTLINEIYASKLGDFRNWSVYEGLSTDSWTASRGTPAPFTGAAVLNGCPLFFREEYLEKVYPSSTGAHQIQTYNIDGVLQGADRSLVVIDNRLYYQSRLGICVYEGTMPRKISSAFGDLVFGGGIAARHLKRYEISMVPAGGGDRIVGVYDIDTGEWFLENSGWTQLAVTWKDEIYTSSTASIYLNQRYTSISHVSWYAETGIIGYELPEHRFISCVRIRMRSQLAGAQTIVKVKIMYDDSGTWIEKGSWTLTQTTGSKEANIFPRRCDHFKLRIEGTGGADILSMSYRMERSEGGH